MKKVYIASPYTRGDISTNIKFQTNIADELIKLGYTPFIALSSHFKYLCHSSLYDKWVGLDSEWVKCCDCVLRVGGVSLGADKKTWFAKKHDIPVFYSIVEMERYYNN